MTKTLTFDEALGARVRARRKAKKIGLDAMANRIHRSVAQLYRYESGETSIDTETLVIIAFVLCCKVDELVEGIEVPK